MTQKKPNILMIVVHDLGTHLGCYQNDSVIPSPNLDRLAEEGVRFDNNFCTAPFCSPSRGSIITGKYPHVNGLMGLTNLGWDLPSSNLFLAQALKNSGYKTYLFGHQHEIKDSSKLGFDFISDPHIDYCAGVAPLVCDFINQKAEENTQPFYCQVGFREVHRAVRVFEHLSKLMIDADDITPLPYLKDTLGMREDLKEFYGTIKDMDLAVGTILESLDKTALKNDTMVVFTTDHGIDFPRAKATLYDAGINTTLIMRWPNGFNGNRTSSELLSNIDLFPTLLEAANVTIPDDVDGRSFLGLLQNKEYAQNKRIFAEKNTSPGDIKRCIRTRQHKYIRNFNEGSFLSMARGTELSPTGLMMDKDYLAPRPFVELYDLNDDPYEQNNLASNPEYAEIETDLSEQLLDFLTETNDPVLTGEIKRPPIEKECLESYYEICKRHLNNAKQKK